MEKQLSLKFIKSKVHKVFGILLIGLMFAALVLSPFRGMQSKALAASSDWKIKSIDTQIISKCWNNVPQDSIDKQIQMLKHLGVNTIAIGTPYERPAEMEKWTNSIHNAGLKVWFRSHWLNWEGDEGQPKNMSTSEYLSKTKQFILDHPSFFKAGDSFTMNVEAENAGLGEGKPFSDWDAYRKFLRDQIDLSNEAFSQIGVNNIATNWLSMNGWIIENALDQATVDKMGMITADHYPPQGSGSNLISINEMADNMSKDLDRFYAKWNKPIMIGEWGYHLDTDVSDEQQRAATEAIYNVLASKSYIYGVNYWDHMGNNTRIINDQGGTPTSYRPAANVIKSFYNGGATPPAGGPTPAPTPTPAPAPATDGLIANFEDGALDGFNNGSVVNNTMRLTNPANGSIGSEKIIDKMSLSGSKTLEMDINLNGNTLLPGDASAIYFDQGGWKWKSLAEYVKNGQNGIQHVSIPLSDLGINADQTAYKIGFRFWNNNSDNYDLDNISFGRGTSTTPTPSPAPSPAPSPSPIPSPAPQSAESKVFDNFEQGFKGWFGGKSATGLNSKRALRINNPANGAYGSKKILNDYKIGDNNYIELDLNLHGAKLISGDASALFMDQGGLRWVTLYDYVENNKDGWQHVRIPLSAFNGLDKNSGLASLGFRFWNNSAGTHDIDNIVFTR